MGFDEVVLAVDAEVGRLLVCSPDQHIAAMEVPVLKLQGLWREGGAHVLISVGGEDQKEDEGEKGGRSLMTIGLS